MTRLQTSKKQLVKVDGLYGLRFYHQRVAVQGRPISWTTCRSKPQNCIENAATRRRLPAALAGHLPRYGALCGRMP